MASAYVLAAVMLAGTTGAHAQSVALTPGEGFEVERYSVALRPDLATTSVSGTETIVVRSTSDRTMQLAFTANALRISDITVDGAPAKHSTSATASVFALPRALKKGSRATLRFRIAGTPKRGLTSLPGGIYSSYFACDWMVCLQDAPGDKAHFALDLFLPAGLASIGAGKAEPVVASTDGLTLHRWRTTRLYPAYLYAFAAGPFVQRSVTTDQGDLAYLDATGTAAKLGKAFAESPAIVAFLADKAGLPLSDRRYVQLLVPGREAQETAGFSLIGSGELDRARDDPAGGWIIAHEMAHAWWGNLVTCASWQELWLNEGIATFMVAAWKEHRWGEPAYRRELAGARQRLERAREQGFDKPLAWGGTYPSLGVRRAIQYSKGALFLDHLRTSIGDAAFWRGLRRFTRDNVGQTVTSADFERAMEQASGRDLSATFAAWVYGG
ncbi:M1 family aminopeptidase [Sphingomonas japonica]|uniref:Aminopeptidase N n=2 Tax=Sphingomonas japonica TaxID=511662 RepID=A0ABX0TW30_9SPHN|nr:M1 family aminopeptidase [Sphingomonas japonica]NIJ22530.1 aminopeptidase N [Sphingomonas japonica]